MMRNKKIRILGETWALKFGTPDKFPGLESADGYCDSSVREMIIRDMHDQEGAPDAKRDLAEYQKQVVRHEITHAFLFESGLASCSTPAEAWANNEEMVDWIAIQSPKLLRAFEEAEAI